MASDMHRLIVDATMSGAQLQDYLECQWPDASRRFLREAIQSGQVTVNCETCHPHRRVGPGDMVECEFTPEDIPKRRQASSDGESEPKTLEVLAEDERLVVVHKPSGMHTLPDRAGKYRGVYGLLQELRPDDDLRIVHRLDAGTSGCLALAKGIDVARAMDLAFREGRVHKEYLALVEGVPRRNQEITRHIGPDRRRPGRMTVVESRGKGAREARTDVTLEEPFRRHALVRAFPRTGRTHQIRVHLAWSGHPIIGDSDYGSGFELRLSRIKSDFKQRRGVRERPLLRRMFLHAEVLTIPGESDGPSLTAKAPMPKELTLVLDKMRRFASPRRPSCD